MSAAAQLSLPTIETGWELVTVDADRQSGKFTAELLEKNAEKRDAVIEALAQGMAIRPIAKAYGISVNTVLTVKRIHGVKIETEKQRLGRDCFDVARMAIERMRDEMENMPRTALPIIAGIMAEKGLLLTGAPTARIEHTGGPTVRSLAEYIDSLPAAIPVGASEGTPQKGVVLKLQQAADRTPVDRASTVSCPLSEVTPSDGQETGQIHDKKETAP